MLSGTFFRDSVLFFSRQLSALAACRRLRCCDTRSAHLRSRSSTVKTYASIAFPGTGIHGNLADRSPASRSGSSAARDRLYENAGASFRRGTSERKPRPFFGQLGCARRLMLRIMLNARTVSAISVRVPLNPRVRNRPAIIRFIVPNGCSAEHRLRLISAGSSVTRFVMRSSASSC